VRLLVRDRYDLSAAAAGVKVPVLWFAWDARSAAGVVPHEPKAFEKISDRKLLVSVNPAKNIDMQMIDALARWLDELPAKWTRLDSRPADGPGSYAPAGLMIANLLAPPG
jgi:hypothetical protein